jgi:hypothetical protein
MEEIADAFKSFNMNWKAGYQENGESHRISLAVNPQHDSTNGDNIPIYSLPPEIISLIFAFIQSMLGLKDAKNLPVKLSHVCRYWRDIVHGAGFLWVEIDISPPWIPAKIDAYLKHSGSHPFRLGCVWPSTLDVDPTSLEMSEMNSLIASNVHRCRGVSIRGDQDSDVFNSITNKLVYLFMGRDLPLLEDFSLDRAGASVVINFNAPSLKHLHLGGLPSISWDFSSNSLTVLHLAINLEYNQFIDFLTSCPLLVELAVYDDHINEWPEVDVGLFESRVTLLHLHSLQIYGNMRDVSELLLSVSAPELYELVIAPIASNDLTGLTDFVNDQPTRFSSLKSLILAPAHGYAFEALPMASRYFPGVEHLAFANIYFDPFKQCFCDDDGPFLFPKLKTIALRGVGEQRAYLIRQMVSFRKDRGHPVETLYVDPLSFHDVTRGGPSTIQANIEKRDVWVKFQQGALHFDDEDRFVGLDEE